MIQSYRDTSGLGTVPINVITGSVAGGSTVAVGALMAAGAIGGPVGIAVTGVIALGATIANWIFAPDTKKLKATQIVNAVEPYMQQNLAAYKAGPHTKSDQTAALANFDALWNQVVSSCSDPSLGSAGANCISDRKTNAKGYNWFALYRDPIANDTTVVADPSPITTLNTAGQIISQSIASASSQNVTGSGLLNTSIMGVPVMLLLLAGGIALYASSRRD